MEINDELLLMFFQSIALGKKLLGDILINAKTTSFDTLPGSDDVTKSCRRKILIMFVFFIDSLSANQVIRHFHILEFMRNRCKRNARRRRRREIF